jgi:hypothetical protein
MVIDRGPGGWVVVVDGAVVAGRGGGADNGVDGGVEIDDVSAAAVPTV